MFCEYYFLADVFTIEVVFCWQYPRPV